MIEILSYSIFFFHLFYFFFNKFFYNIFLDNDFSKKQCFHKLPTPRFGGLLFALTVFFVYIFVNIQNSFFNLIFCLSFLNLILGTLDDVKFIINPVKRFFLFFFINLTFIFFFKIQIYYFDFIILDYLNSFFFTSLILAFFCIFFSVNGSNLIDGFDGLLTVHSIIIFFILFFLSKTHSLLEINNLFFVVLVSLIVFLFYNFPFAKIFLGDGGSFFIGSLIAMTIIYLSNNINYISPFFYAILIHYIFFEILFSVLRKLAQKKILSYQINITYICYYITF